MDDYDDDEIHFCNKCKSDVRGIKNYIRHRATSCRIISEQADDEIFALPTSKPNPYPELNADAFFSSLELQSSSKQFSVQPQSTRSIPITSQLSEGGLRRSARQKERRRKQDFSKEKSPEVSVIREEKFPLPAVVVADLDDLGIPPLAEFPEIVASSSKVPTIPIKKEDDQRIGRTMWLKDTMLSDLARIETNDLKRGNDAGTSILPTYDDESDQSDFAEEDEEEDVEVEEEEEEEEAEEPQDRIQDSSNTSSDESEDEFDSDSDNNERDYYRRRAHTGGKWKPDDIPAVMVTGDMMDVNEEEIDDEEHPPPTHTGGKWKPPDCSTIQVSTR